MKNLKRLNAAVRFLGIPMLILLSCDTQEIITVPDNASFLAFTTNGQTLPTAIHNSTKHVVLEVDHDIDITGLTPKFEIPQGHVAYVNGVKQLSGISRVDFSKPVTYELRDETNHVTTWEVSAVSLGCKILIDASHDGGVWWYPQYKDTGFDQNTYHQGQGFANALRQKGFDVTELGRDAELTEEMFFGYYIVIRASGFEPYTSKELAVYTNLIERGMNLVFFTDHKKYDPIDELGDHLGLQFKGSANGTISRYATHEITTNMGAMNYIAGSVITNADKNPNIELLGWLGEEDFVDLNFNEIRDAGEVKAPPVMGVLNYPKSRIFFMGDMNCTEVRPQPFIDNLINWMGSCQQW